MQWSCGCSHTVMMIMLRWLNSKGFCYSRKGGRPGQSYGPWKRLNCRCYLTVARRNHTATDAFVTIDSADVVSWSVPMYYLSQCGLFNSTLRNKSNGLLSRRWIWIVVWKCRPLRLVSAISYTISLTWYRRIIWMRFFRLDKAPFWRSP